MSMDTFAFFDPNPYPELRELTFEQSNELLKEAIHDEDQFDWLVFYYFTPIWEVIPYELEQDILDTAYPSIDEALESLRYCKRWGFKAEKEDYFDDWPIEVYKIYRTDLGKIMFQTYILYNQSSNTYHVMSLDDFSAERFNQLVKVSITTSEQALDYAKGVASMITPYGHVIDKDLLNPEGTWYYNIKLYLDVISLPKITMKAQDYHVIELFYYTGNVYGTTCDVSKIVVIVNQEGKIALLKSNLEKRH